MKKFFALTLLTLIFALSGLTHAGEKNDPDNRILDTSENVETTIFADRMVSESDKNRMTFTGNVVAHHGDMTVKSRELEVYSDKEQNKMELIVAIGEVVITTKNNIMKSDRAEMYQLEKKLVLIGNASITQGENNITGEKIIYYYDKEDIIVGGGVNERATFKVTPSKEKQKQGK